MRKNKFFHYFRGFLCVVLYPAYLVYKIMQFIVMMITPFAALFYLGLLVVDFIDVWKDDFVIDWPYQAGFLIMGGIVIMIGYFIIATVAGFLSTALTIPANMYINQRMYFDLEKNMLYRNNRAHTTNRDIDCDKQGVYCEEPPSRRIIC